MNAFSQASPQIDVETLDRLRREAAGIVVLDVREPWEREICAIEPSVGIPLGQLPDRINTLQVDDTMVVVCHHGMRSLRATLWLREQGFPAVINLEGGIDAWADRIDRKMVRY